MKALRIVLLALWCTWVWWPGAAHWPFACKVVGWGFNFPG
jgi:hypothetical protein